MNITITRLELTNFKCFHKKGIAFDPHVTTIRGRNGVGKTTIADAILWCLFGKNSQGQSDFDLKTHSSDGSPIPNLDHSVEMQLNIDERVVTLKRTLKETWIKKRGSNEQVFKNNTTEYQYNGEACTATDYKKHISELVSEDVFRAITTPTYFPSLKWQQQREFLTQMAGEITLDTAEFAELIAQLSESNEDIIAYRKHLSYQIKQIKDKLDKIPVRLEEQHKALPELLDWESLNVRYAEALSQQKEIEAKIMQVRTGGADDVRKEEVRKQLNEAYERQREEQERIQKEVFSKQAEQNAKVAELTNKFRELLYSRRTLETTIPALYAMLKRCQETLEQCEKDAQAIREEWAHNQSRHFYFDESRGICPTCGQYLPQEQIEEKRREAEENLNADKARIKAELTERAAKVKALRADTEEEIKSIEARKAEAEKQAEELHEQMNAAFSEKQTAEKELACLPTYEYLKEQSLTLKAIKVEIANLETELQKASVNTEADTQLADLESQKVACDATLSQLQSQLATRPLYERIESLIEGINEEQKNLVAQLSELERREDMARSYQDRQNAVLESRINEHFSLVQWRMFRTVNNGGDPFQEPYCECYVNGVAYHDGLNQAARLNAGLDIINNLCKHYDVYAPIVVDNSESNLNILDTDSQQIRLEVHDSELQII